MGDEPDGLYRVRFSLPGSVAACARRFVYDADDAQESVRQCAMQHAKESAYTHYGVRSSEVEFESVELLYEYDANQLTLNESALIDEAEGRR